MIRKHFLYHTAKVYCTKHQNSMLKTCIPETWVLELDYAEYLEEALNDSFELRDYLVVNEEYCIQDRKWFILKPSMTDGANGIRLFSTLEELTNIFLSMESANSDEDSEDDRELLAHQLRYFVIQEYVSKPLLYENRKFHIRTYVLALGALQVYVSRNMLALFSKEKYKEPSCRETERMAHLSNTVIQEEPEANTIRLFWELNIDEEIKCKIWKDIIKIAFEIFNAAALEQRQHFQPLPNAFEVYGLDFLVDENSNTLLLEVNSYPDFAKSGDELRHTIETLFHDIMGVVTESFFEDKVTSIGNLVKVLEVQCNPWYG